MKAYKPVSDREIARRLSMTSINSAYYYLPIIQKIFGLGLMICERTDGPQGEWIDAKNAGWKCTVCGKWSNGQYDYCPNCGADMRKGTGDEN